MDDRPDRRGPLVVAGLTAGAALLVGLLFMGGSTARILSTVGSSVNTPTGARTGGSAGDGSRSAGDGSGGPESGADEVPGSRSDADAGGQVADAAGAAPTLLIVRTGTLTVQVADLDAAVRDGDAAVIRAGGYVSGSSRAADGGSQSAVVTYRIPSAAWVATLGALHGLASKVVSEEIKTDEVSAQVVDLTARIANLRATEAALQAIMARAARISDVLDVQEQLTATRGDIERLVADRAHLEDRAAYGSLAVTYRLPVLPTPTATPLPAKGWDPGDDVARASGKLVRIGQTTTSIGIWLAIVGLPVAIGGLVVLAGAWQVYRLGRWLVRRREAMLPEA
jgi:hypothetical protein